MGLDMKRASVRFFVDNYPDNVGICFSDFSLQPAGHLMSILHVKARIEMTVQKYVQAVANFSDSDSVYTFNLRIVACNIFDV